MMQELRPLSVLPPPLPSLHKMTLDELRDAVIQCMLEGPAGHYRVGKIYNHIVKNRRAVYAGYPTTREYFRRHVRVLSHLSLTMYGAVARKFDQAVCEKYGMANLGALLEYERLRYGSVMYVPGEPGNMAIEIPRRGGLTLTKPFADCTPEDLRQAVRARRAPRRNLEADLPIAGYKSP
ncbi:MAG TPA: hypothetical protein VF815_30480 [Myxococcaceae bacterium]|jgi:hypothetical protein